MGRFGASLSLAALTALLASPALAEDKLVVRSVDDLPQASYQIPGTVESLLTAPSDAFGTVVAPIGADIAKVLTRYDIADHATMRALLEGRLGIEIATGKQDRAALATIEAIRAIQDKPDAQLTSQLAPQAFLEARIADKIEPGGGPQSFATIYKRHLDALPWNVVGTTEIRLKGYAQVATLSFLIGAQAGDIQPVLDRAHALSTGPALELLAGRVAVDVIAACRQQIETVTTTYVAAHQTVRPDIWPARTAALASHQKLSPVRVAIWDSGFDPAQFPGQVMLDKTGKPVIGPTYDIHWRPTTGLYGPLTPAQHADYPQVVKDFEGISDLQTGLDSTAAATVRQRVAAMSGDQVRTFMDEEAALQDYMHGTHVAGLATAGNPAIRMVSARMTFDSSPVPIPPTDAIQQRIAAAYAASADWFRANGIRVVNMSWWNRPSSYEEMLEKNGIGKTSEERKQLARHYFTIERDGLLAALKSAPGILFVTIAGNNDSDNAFEEAIPSSFNLLNLIVVGAVDQAGQQNNFTSTGKNIAVYADGYQVESVVPGGAHVRMSGTSMSAPEVVNLAAKLLAVQPSLTPEQVIAIITKTADTGEAATIRRINPKLALASVTPRKR